MKWNHIFFIREPQLKLLRCSSAHRVSNSPDGFMQPHRFLGGTNPGRTKTRGGEAQISSDSSVTSRRRKKSFAIFLARFFSLVLDRTSVALYSSRIKKSQSESKVQNGNYIKKKPRSRLNSRGESRAINGFDLCIAP